MKANIPTLEQLKRAAAIAEQITRLEDELQAIFGNAKPGRKKKSALDAAPAAAPVAAKRGPKAKKAKRVINFSPEARARIAAAQKARWARFRKDKKAEG
ncbi:MAG TPA: hypothetical protein DIT64_12545 [Verrucomicrobiales bacterium]|nr:hypothetical protein [Verrucomicrobiales bacterium]HCN79473.1 hypothetical protein [Verrucomicrobiales bacterium]HRJ07626.1 hypothetical protein [Prosthecobacter sp.]HRK13393.1 hypothetical protein [Prosthecobacter sp.]